MPVYLEKQAQIETEAQNRDKIKTLLYNKAPTKISAKYFDYNNIFSLKNIVKLLANF